jgi:phenylpropionate dioxygenase-like ring-hydroxylating dioxygenase large terminal subunit
MEASSQKQRYTTEGILPPHVYFDSRWHDIAVKLVYSKMSNFVGHVSQIPEPGSWALALDEKQKYFITQDATGKIHCFDKRCRHQNALLKDVSVTPTYVSPAKYGRVEALKLDPTHGKESCLVCPLHQWTWNLDGTLRGAPHFDMAELSPERRHLKEIPVRVWNGMIFTVKEQGDLLPWEEEFASYPRKEQFDLSDYFMFGSVVYHFPYSLLVFLLIYMDDRHVQFGHRFTYGLMMNMQKLLLAKGKSFNVQEVGYNMKPRGTYSPEYQAWNDWIRRLSGGEEPTYGALWSCFFPNFMIEVFPGMPGGKPGAVVVSIVDPVAVDRSTNRCFFFYPKGIYARIREVLEAESGTPASTEQVEAAFRDYAEDQQAAYSRTGAEDEEHQNRVAAGHKIAYEDEPDFRGLPHPIEEEGIFDFAMQFAEVEACYQEMKSRQAA